MCRYSSKLYTHKSISLSSVGTAYGKVFICAVFAQSNHIKEKAV